MSNQILVYSGLTALTTLHLITEILEDDLSNLDILQQNFEIAFHTHEDNTLEVVLILHSSESTLTLSESLNIRHNSITGRSVETIYTFPQQRYPLLSHLSNLVIAPLPLSVKTNPNLVRDEHVLYSFGLTDRAAQSIDKRLRIHATSVRVARADAGPTGNYFFHVKHDDARRSSFSSALQAGDYNELTLLDVYQSGSWRVLLPTGLQLDHQRTDIWVRFLHLYLEATNRKHPNNGILAAIIPASPTENIGHTLIFTYHLNFLPIEQVFGSYRPSAVIEAALKDGQKALTELAQQIKKQDTESGYWLRLRPAIELQPEIGEYEQLKQDIQYMLQALEEIEGQITTPGPRLLRFEQGDLEILIAILAACPPDQLQNILYGFFSGDKAHLAGVHYLYIPENVTMTGADPLFMKTSHDRQKIEYWLDPVWRVQYKHQIHDANNIFVPYGTRLYPSFHSWDVEDINAYLAQIFNKQKGFELWHRQVQNAQSRMYVFEPTDTTSSDIRLLILDSSKLVPISSPKVINWINDNLILINSTGLEGFITTLANEAKRSAYLKDVKDKRAGFEIEIQNTQNRLSAQINQSIESVYQYMIDEVNRIVSETEQQLKTVTQFNERIEKYRALYKTMQKTVTELDKQFGSLTGTVKNLEVEMARLRLNLNSAINEARKEQEKFIEQRVAVVNELQMTREKLQEKFLDAQKKATDEQQKFLKRKENDLSVQHTNLSKARNAALQKLDLFIQRENDELQEYIRIRDESYEKFKTEWENANQAHSEFIELKRQNILRLKNEQVTLQNSLDELKRQL